MKLESAENLKNCLREFKDITVEIIRILEKDEFEELNNLLDSRESTINKMNDYTFSKETFKQLCTEFDILPLQHKLIQIINIKRSNIKNEISRIETIKSAGVSYNKKSSLDSLYVNKKI